MMTHVNCKKNILVPVNSDSQKQTDDIRNAMAYFEYFDELDEEARREGCTIAKIKFYKVNETIFGDGTGIQNFVYFVVSGHCQMIETLDVVVTDKLTGRYYTLIDPFVSEAEQSEKDLEKEHFAVFSKHDKRSCFSDNKTKDKFANSNILEAAKKSDHRQYNKEKEITNISLNTRKTVTFCEPENHEKKAQDPNEVLLASCELHKARPNRQKRNTKLSKIYMQVCIFRPGSSFGFGENMRDRRVIALTSVHCMLMPKLWLHQRNTANIWTRIQLFLEKKIPSKKQLFEEFLSQHRWQKYRDDLVEEILRRSKTVNYSCLQDVPLSIRMEEMCNI